MKTDNTADNLDMKNRDFGIITHYAPCAIDELPWLAIPMPKAISALDGYPITDEQRTSIPHIMAAYCRLLDEAGLVFYGTTEAEAQNAALRYCYANGKTKTMPNQEIFSFLTNENEQRFANVRK